MSAQYGLALLRMSVVKMRRPTSSLGPSSDSAASSARFASASLVGLSGFLGSLRSPIESETSNSSSTLDGFFSNAQPSSASAVVPSAGATASPASAGRSPASPIFFFAGAVRVYATNAPAPAPAAGAIQGGSGPPGGLSRSSGPSAG